ncbi:hypothetical protein IWQ60_010805 [Tieghemiomyces parasiticus]|uniref:DUF962 domain-containing protein n=1 Tax=Tieghemiomyces parasiticus TaxID=78921 RepID=A0A9W8DJ65_9FUNG|nr:hypothetical protein IWQ60_010805 [Tieghemiomyces parasiticus]
MGIFNLKEQFAFYGSYHHDHRNMWVHIVFVPAILWSFWVMASLLGPLPGVSMDGCLAQSLRHLGFEPHLPFFMLLLYFLYYLVLDFVAATLYLPFLLTFYYTSTSLAATHPHALAIGAGVHIVSWMAQFYSHAVWEKRAPALTDNLSQALLMAPFFVFIEVLFMLGYRPRFQAEVEALIESRLQEFQATRSPNKSAKQ